MNIITIISPLVLVAFVGFISTKTQWLKRAQLDALTQFTFYIAIPAFLFYQMAHADFSQHVTPALFAAFYIPVLMCYWFSWLANFYFHPTLKKQASASAVFALGASYSNTIIVGLPILLMAIGEEVLGIVFLIVTFHSAMLFTLTSAISARNKYFNWGNFIKQLINNPVILSILSGLIFNISPLTLPKVIDDSLLLMGKPAITLALFILGASLSFYQVKKEVCFIGLASIVKLILLPFLVYLTAHYLFQLQTMITTVLVILSASPTGVNAYLIAKEQQQHQETVAGTVVVSTLLSVVTIPCWLWWLN